MNIIVLSIRLGGVRTFSGKRSHVAIESLCKWLRDACLLRTFVHVYALVLMQLSTNAPLSIMFNSLQDRNHIPAAVIHAAKFFLNPLYLLINKIDFFHGINIHINVKISHVNLYEVLEFFL